MQNSGERAQLRGWTCSSAPCEHRPYPAVYDGVIVRDLRRLVCCLCLYQTIDRATSCLRLFGAVVLTNNGA